MKLLLSFGQVDFVTQPRYESMKFDPTTSTRSSLAPSSLPVGRYVSHYGVTFATIILQTSKSVP